MQEPKHQSPFKVLGKHLKFLRENRQESLAEVSGAVEIDPEALERMERGQERPSEEILMLLINHFGMQDHEAVQLWESAGYDRDAGEKFRSLNNDPQIKTAMVLLALDVRVMYSDGIAITGNQSGVVLNFTQTGTQSQELPVARVGMSYEQAEEVLRALQQAVLRHKYLPNPRLLPPGLQ
jgi:transcriptional regulator with XRE-family HTH domain